MTTAPAVKEALPAKKSASKSRDESLNVLFCRWQDDRDPTARETLVRRYLPLARKCAMRYTGAYEPTEDLMQVASLGLLGAIDRFDTSRGISFSSFAVPTILGELKRYFRDSGWAVHVPRGPQERAIKVEQAQRRLSVEAGRAPTVNELAEYLEMSIEDVLEAMEAAAAHHAISLETPREEDDQEASTLGDSVGTFDDGYRRAELGATITALTKHLSDRDRRVLALRFMADRTQAEIAAEIGVSQMQVSRILSRALDRLSKLAAEDAAPALGA